ncbi:RNA polymerase sigma factor [Virgibacillus doumboii]|uniref:RNA polymerase sigma factor n=1 Tax=Virgibacillus doumboii TaxID=2697503 RepID=UPI0013DFC5E8|nr:RNA polymerase sigma factor [Virgibacillus doumboii]
MEDLIDACKTGDIVAYGKLIDHYSSTVERFAFQIGVPFQDVPDVSQEVFIRIYRHLDRFDGKSSFSSWLYKITLNSARDYHRKHSSLLKKFNRLKNEKSRLSHSTENSLKQVLKDEEDQFLHMCINQLNEKYRIPIVLHYFHDMKYEQISEIIGVKLSTVKVRVMRGKKLLAENLESGEREGGFLNG